MKKIIGVMQARMGSSRLPGKVFLPLADRPLVWHIMTRLRAVKSISDIFIATTSDKKNDVLEDFSNKNQIICYRHSDENDIVGRFNAISKLVDYDVMIKVNCDCPLIDNNEIQKLLDIFLEKKLDFASNQFSNTYPLGYSFQILHSDLIKKCDYFLSNKTDRELFIKWIMDNKESFKTDTISYKRNMSKLRLTLDTKEDYLLMKRIFEKLFVKNEIFGIKEVLNFLN